jgi:hypothetical protein
MATLTEVFPCFFLNCKANSRVKPAKTGHGPHSFYFLCCSMYFLFYVFLCCSMYFLFYVFLCCSMYCLFLFRSLYCLCVYTCTVLLPPGGYPVAVKYIISYITYILSYILYIIYHDSIIGLMMTMSRNMSPL